MTNAREAELLDLIARLAERIWLAHCVIGRMAEPKMSRAKIESQIRVMYEQADRVDGEEAGCGLVPAVRQGQTVHADLLSPVSGPGERPTAAADGL